MPVPDVAVPVLCPTAGEPRVRPGPAHLDPARPGPAYYLATKSLLTSRKMKKHSSLGV